MSYTRYSNQNPVRLSTQLSAAFPALRRRGRPAGSISVIAHTAALAENGRKISQPRGGQILLRKHQATLTKGKVDTLGFIKAKPALPVSGQTEGPRAGGNVPSVPPAEDLCQNP